MKTKIDKLFFQMLIGKILCTKTLCIENKIDAIYIWTSDLLWRGVLSISSGVDDNLSSSLTRNGQCNVALLLVDSGTICLWSYQLKCQLSVVTEVARYSVGFQLLRAYVQYLLQSYSINVARICNCYTSMLHDCIFNQLTQARMLQRGFSLL